MPEESQFRDVGGVPRVLFSWKYMHYAPSSSFAYQMFLLQQNSFSKHGANGHTTARRVVISPRNPESDNTLDRSSFSISLAIHVIARILDARASHGWQHVLGIAFGARFVRNFVVASAKSTAISRGATLSRPGCSTYSALIASLYDKSYTGTELRTRTRDSSWSTS
jgi:hypothetical protein